jgi:hypothetical protein
MPRYHAEVIHLTAKPADDDRFCTVPFEAEHPYAAARLVANMAATRKYGDESNVMSSFLQFLDDGDPSFRATIGAAHWFPEPGTCGVVGVTIKIRILNAPEA